MPVAASQGDIYDHLKAYFCGRFNVDPSDLSATDDLRARFGFQPQGWAALADTLSRLDWMQAIHVQLAPADMLDAKTLADLADLVWKRTTPVALIASDTAERSIISLRAASAIVAKRRKKRSGKKRGPAKRKASRT